MEPALPRAEAASWRKKQGTCRNYHDASEGNYCVSVPELCFVRAASNLPCFINLGEQGKSLASPIYKANIDNITQAG